MNIYWAPSMYTLGYGGERHAQERQCPRFQETHIGRQKISNKQIK